jgi:hypothetical protein
MSNRETLSCAQNPATPARTEPRRWAWRAKRSPKPEFYPTILAGAGELRKRPILRNTRSSERSAEKAHPATSRRGRSRRIDLAPQAAHVFLRNKLNDRTAGERGCLR